uniref:Uncharacterized protein n=1 Tax=Schistocephalus solidus TaxID=70667 RepID=A0A0X3PQT8_SCHSO
MLFITRNSVKYYQYAVRFCYRFRTGRHHPIMFPLISIFLLFNAHLACQNRDCSHLLISSHAGAFNVVLALLVRNTLLFAKFVSLCFKEKPPVSAEEKRRNTYASWNVVSQFWRARTSSSLMNCKT